MYLNLRGNFLTVEDSRKAQWGKYKGICNGFYKDEISNLTSKSFLLYCISITISTSPSYIDVFLIWYTFQARL